MLCNQIADKYKTEHNAVFTLVVVIICALPDHKRHRNRRLSLPDAVCKTTRAPESQTVHLLYHLSHYKQVHFPLWGWFPKVMIFFIFMDPCIVDDSVEIPTRCSFVIEFIIPNLLKAQHVSSGKPLIIRSSKLYLQPLVYIPMWWPAVVRAEWEKLETANTV